jgi:hypothetical protein
MAGLYTEIFAADIAKNLFPENQFYKNAKDDSAWVNNDVVNLPQSGSKPNVEIDRAVVPAPVKKRTDSSVSYSLKEFTTDPILIRDSEELVLNYNKRASILEDHIFTLNEEICNYHANTWFGGIDFTNCVVRTSGSNRTGYAPAATGNRKAMKVSDLIDAMNKLDRQDIPSNGRILVLPASMKADIQKDELFQSADKWGSANIPSGAIGSILGCAVYIRSKVGVFDQNAAASKGVGQYAAAGATTDNEAAMLYHPLFVRRAEGSVKVYDELDSPVYYGSVFSAMVRAGAKVAREDKKGVVAIVEQA